MHIHLIFSFKYLGLEWLNHIIIVELSKKLLTVFLGGCDSLHSPQQCLSVPVPSHSGHLVSYALLYVCSDLLFCLAAKPCLTLCDPMDGSTPGIPVLPILCSGSCPLSPWCHPTISSSAGFFSSCLQSLPALGSFPMSQLFESGSQSIEVSASATVLPVNIQGWFPSGLTGLISLLSLQGTLKSLLQHHSLKASVLPCSAFFMVQLSYPYMTTRKMITFTIQTFVGKVMFCLFICCLARFVIAFLPRSKWCVVISHCILNLHFPSD